MNAPPLCLVQNNYNGVRYIIPVGYLFVTYSTVSALCDARLLLCVLIIKNGQGHHNKIICTIIVHLHAKQIHAEYQTKGPGTETSDKPCCARNVGLDSPQ